MDVDFYRKILGDGKRGENPQTGRRSRNICLIALKGLRKKKKREKEWYRAKILRKGTKRGTGKESAGSVLDGGADAEVPGSNSWKVPEKANSRESN